MKRQLIGLVGLIGSGKGTTGEILQNEYNFSPMSYAGTLKDCLSIIFGWPRDMIEGDTPESRKWREKVDSWWSKELNIENFTPRLAMQLVGTNALRSHVSENLWVSVLHHKLNCHHTGRCVITDCRFPNEIDLIRKLGGQVWRIKRGDDPDWFDTAMECNSINDPSKMNQFYPEVHISEWAWVGQPIDRTITNDTTLDELKDKIKCLISTL